MSKTGDTKRRIIEILQHRKVTLTDISERLDLAPSTVSQHLKEMVGDGTIRQADDGRPRKWKYYELNSNYNTAAAGRSYFDLRRMGVPIAVVAIVLALSLLLLYSNQNVTANAQQVYIAPGAPVPSGSTVFTVSDSPTFYNISALVVTVTNASIHSSSTGKWYSIPIQANSFNLVKLRNISSIIGGVRLRNGTYDLMVLSVSNITATINGSARQVYVPSRRLVLMERFNISNGTTNWVNLDFNLERSLHITGNGMIVMLPVVGVRHVSDDSIRLDSNSIVVASAPGRILSSGEFGMDENGNMVHNFTVKQNVSILTDANGALRVNGTVSTPIIIRTDNYMMIGGNASAIIGSSRIKHIMCCPASRDMGMPCIIVAFGTKCPFIGAYAGINQSAKANISASDLNNGKYEDVRSISANATLVNVSIERNASASGVQCRLQDGALGCEIGWHARPGDIVADVGQPASIGINGVRPISIGISQNASSSTQTGSSASGSGAIRVNSSENGSVNSTIGKLVVKEGTCVGLGLGQC